MKKKKQITAGVLFLIILSLSILFIRYYYQRERSNKLLETNDEFEIVIHSLNDNDANIRKKAAIMLGFINDSRAVKPLLEVLNDKDKYVRAYAAFCFRRDKRHSGSRISY